MPPWFRSTSQAKPKWKNAQPQSRFLIFLNKVDFLCTVHCLPPSYSSYARLFFLVQVFSMPTPRGSTPRDRSAHIQHDTDPLPERAIPHTTCPTDPDRPGLWSRLTSAMSDDAITGLLARRQDDSIVERGSSSSDRLTASDTIQSNSPQAKPATMDQETSTSEGSSPMSVTSDSKEVEPHLLSPSALISSALGDSSPLNCGMPHIRVR